MTLRRLSADGMWQCLPKLSHRVDREMAEKIGQGALLVGRTFSPLPEESWYGSLTRISRMNELTARDVRHLFFKSGRDETDPLDTISMRSLLGWELQYGDSPELRNIASLKDILWSETLRYCPICMEAGYHSVWHQFVALEVCLIHACPLRQRCMCCNTTLDEYRLAPHLIGLRFRCSHCGDDFAGVAFTIDAHAAFREQAVELLVRAARYREWLLSATCHLLFLAEARRRRRRWPVRRFSPADVELWRGTVDLVHPFPTGCASQHRYARLLAWQVRQHKSMTHSLEMAARSRLLSAGTVWNTYCAFLRQLKAAIDSRWNDDCPPFLDFSDGRCVLQGDWKPEQLAFVLLRCHCESLSVLRYELDRVEALQSARLTNALANNLLHAPACRAVFISGFAALVVAARQYISSGVFDYRAACEIPTDALSLVVAETNNIQCGVAIVADPGGVTGDLLWLRGGVDPGTIATLNALLLAARN